MAELINKIEAFLDRHAMEASHFGKRAIKDTHLVFDLRDGERKLRRATIRRIEVFMEKQDARQK